MEAARSSSGSALPAPITTSATTETRLPSMHYSTTLIKLTPTTTEIKMGKWVKKTKIRDPVLTLQLFALWQKGSTWSLV